MPLTTIRTSNLDPNNGLLFRNRIINGAMVIDQRNAGASVSNPDGLYIVDRWIYQSSQNSKVTIQQNQNSVTPPTGFTYYSGITSSSAYTVLAGDYFLYRQKIEGFNVADLAWGTASAATVTLSFWVRSSLTGTFGGSLTNSAQNRSYPFTYTISSANTWEQKSITIAGDTSGTWLTTNGIGIHVGFSLGAGSTYSGTAGAWAGSALFSATGATSVVGTNGATFYITGVQLEKGSTATAFDYRPFGTELTLCQRYYETSFNSGQAVANGIYTQTSMAYIAYSDQWALVTPFISFKVPKRATPTMTAYGNNGRWQNYNPAGGWIDWTTGSTAMQDAGQGGQNPVTTGFSVYTHNNSNSGLAVGYVRAIRGDWTASSEI